MVTQVQRDRFTILRYEYYIGARCTLFHGLLTSCAYLFGHAVELSFKHIMTEQNITEKQNSHNIKELFDMLKNKGYLDVEVSSDFINYISHAVMSRYPSQIEKESERALNRGEILGFDSSLIAYFDDFILQLDDIILSQTGDPNTSIGNKASTKLGEILDSGKSFFHGNVAALCRIEQYLQFATDQMNNELDRLQKSCFADDQMKEMNIQTKTEHYKECIRLLEGKSNTLWDNEMFPMYIRGDFDFFKGKKFAKDFIYPGKLNSSTVKKTTSEYAVYTCNNGIQMIRR